MSSILSSALCQCTDDSDVKCDPCWNEFVSYRPSQRRRREESPPSYRSLSPPPAYKSPSNNNDSDDNDDNNNNNTAKKKRTQGLSLQALCRMDGCPGCSLCAFDMPALELASPAYPAATPTFCPWEEDSKDEPNYLPYTPPCAPGMIKAKALLIGALPHLELPPPMVPLQPSMRYTPSYRCATFRAPPPREIIDLTL